MRLWDRLTTLALRNRASRRTVRFRLTAIYSALFLASGAALLAVTYVLVSHALGPPYFAKPPNGGAVFGLVKGAASSRHLLHGAGLTSAQLQAQAADLRAQALSDHARALHQLLLSSGIALGAMLVVSVALGWLVAGRILRPLRTITRAAQVISAHNLDRRLALEGADDELKELGDTFDGLLGRLEGAFFSQRQFVANASHELRSPLARQRAVGQVALADPNATVESLRAVVERILAAGRQEERLIDALLTLSRGQAGVDRQDPMDLSAIADRVLSSRREEAERKGLAVRTALVAAPMMGDARLLERLTANLVDNAVRYNLDQGRIEVTTSIAGGAAILSVTNTGPLVPAEAVDQLLRPFQRLGPERTGHGEGLGLGLSIVEAITAAHGGTLLLRPRPEGGLEVTVSFPVAPPAGGRGPAGTHAEGHPPVTGQPRPSLLETHTTSAVKPW